jgi:hypothetical protein
MIISRAAPPSDPSPQARSSQSASTPLAADALKRAIKTLKVEDVEALMIKIARRSVSDVEVMEALMPGSAGGDVAPRPLGQRTAI